MKLLDQLVLVEGFQKEGGQEQLVKLSQVFQRVLGEARGIRNAVKRVNILQSCPRDKSQMNPVNLARELSDKIDRVLDASPRNEERMIVGVSFGGLITLAEEINRIKTGREQQFTNVALVNGPLNPDVEVPPPPFGDFGEVYGLQYDARQYFSEGLVRDLLGMSFGDRSRIMSIGTVDGDPFVPPRAKRLDGAIRFAPIPEVQGHGLSDEMIRALVKRLVGMCMEGKTRDATAVA